jgi:hypothetical protein
VTKLEKEIEQKLRKLVEHHGGRCLKLVCLSFAGFPDRTILLPHGYIIFVETKRPKGGVYSALQDKWRDWLLKLGFTYWRIKDQEQLDTFEVVLAYTMRERT